jgi:hypothetical protein
MAESKPTVATTDSKPTSQGADNVQLQDFVGLPLRALIVEPLVASATGQRDLAQVTLNFIKDIGFTTDTDGKTQLRTVEIDVPRLIDGQSQPLMQRVNMPLIAMVTIPNLAVDSVSIDFTMQVQAQTKNETVNTDDKSTTTTTNTGDDNKAEIKGGGILDIFDISGSDTNDFKTDKSTTITGTVTSKSTNTRSTDFSAKYDVSVRASQQRPSEGMSKLMQIIASCIEPVNLSKS